MPRRYLFGVNSIEDYIPRPIQQMTKTFTLRINFYSVLIALFVYSYGFYGFRRLEPIWQNLDGKVFFWTNQIFLIISLLVVLFVQFNHTQSEVLRKNFKINISIKEISFFLAFVCFQLVFSSSFLTLDLFGDETSYLKYSIHQIQTSMNLISLEIQNSQPAKNLYRIAVTFGLIVLYIVLRLVSKLSWKTKVIIAGLFTLLLRIFNEKIFKYDNIYTEPITLFYNVGTAAFGFSNTGIRFTGLVVNAFFAIIMHLIFVRYLNYGNFKAFISSCIIISLPLGFLGATKIDHAKFTYYLFTIFIILLFAKKSIPSRVIAFTLVLGFYFSFSSISLIVFLLFYSIINSYRRNQLVIHLKNEWRIYLFLLPQFVMHLSRIIMATHLSKHIDGYVSVSYPDRARIILNSVISSSDLYNLILIILGIVFFPKALKMTRSGLFLFLCILSVTSILFIYVGALGENRYVLQYFYCLYPIVVIRLLDSSRSIKFIANAVLALMLMANIYSISVFTRSVEKFDSFLVKSNWRIASDYYLVPSRQPKYIYYPSVSYSEVFRLEKDFLLQNRCLLSGYYFGGMPEFLSGYSHKEIEVREKLFSKYRFVINDINLFLPGDTVDTKDLTCVIISTHSYKRDLVDYFIRSDWRIDKQYLSRNGIKVFVLSKKAIN
jgi:hypothetical protein